MIYGFEFSTNKETAIVRNLAYGPKMTPSVKFGHTFLKFNSFGTHPVTSANVDKKTYF